MSANKKKGISKIISHAVLLAFSVVFSLPFIWMIITSLKTSKELFTDSLSLIPRSLQWSNYSAAFSSVDFMRLTGNTLFVTVLTILGFLISVPLVAYSCSLIEWRGKKIVFSIVMATMMLPGQVTLIPVYMIWNKLGVIGTYVPLILPAYFAMSGFYIFMMRQFFMTLPMSIINSAVIDGASEFRIYSQIILPLTKPALAAISIFAFMGAWGDFFGPLIYLNKASMYTLSLGLTAFTQEHYVEWEKLMAASAMFTVPIIIIFFMAQKYFIEGITLTGIKG